MGEIRSTLDLIMERTRGMALSEDEKKGIREERLSKRAKGFHIRLMESPDTVEEVLQSLGEEPEEDRKDLESRIWRGLVESLTPDKELFGTVTVMERLPQAKVKGPILRELRARFTDELKDKSKDRKKILVREQKKLASHGISGTAVVAKMPKESPTDGGLASVLEEFKNRLLDAA